MNINELKNEFVMPKVEITLFESEDVITTSGFMGEDDNLDKYPSEF